MRLSWLLALCTAALLAAPCRGAEDDLLWYSRPASGMGEALPIGNGRLGGMVFGGVDVERIQLSEESLWSGSPRDADKPDARAALAEVRRLLFDGKYAQADALAAEKLVCDGAGSGLGKGAGVPYGCFQTLGDLTIRFDVPGEPREYRRRLDLDRAIVGVGCRIGDAAFTREAFSSAVDQVLVLRMTCDKPGGLRFRVDLTRPERFVTEAQVADELAMRGQLDDGRGGHSGMKYAARVKVLVEGGTVGAKGNSLRVAGANAATLLLSAATDYRLRPPDYRGDAPEELTAARLARAAAKPYDTLRDAHVADHRRYFRRVSLTLCPQQGDAKPASALPPTDERLQSLRAGAADARLMATWFQYGRYLLLASSRPGDLPANLQGIWAEGIETPWNDDYHNNIDVEMNYWPARRSPPTAV